MGSEGAACREGRRRLSEASRRAPRLLRARRCGSLMIDIEIDSPGERKADELRTRAPAGKLRNFASAVEINGLSAVHYLLSEIRGITQEVKRKSHRKTTVIVKFLS